MPAAKLARVAMMTLNHNGIMRTPWAANPTPAQTMTVLDLPQYYVDTYGIHDLEFQHGHLAKDTSNPDPEFFKEMKAKLDAAQSRANQINIEIGTMATMGPDGKAAAALGRRACHVAGDREEVGRRGADHRHQAPDAQSGRAHRRLEGRRHVALEGTAGLRATEADHDLRGNPRERTPADRGRGAARSGAGGTAAASATAATAGSRSGFATSREFSTRSSKAPAATGTSTSAARAGSRPSSSSTTPSSST